MGRFASVWSALEPRQRLVAALAVVATLAVLGGLVQAARQPSMATLYSGLDSAAAGEVMAAVEAMGVKTEARGGAVLVPIGDRDRVRLALAAEGLPRNGPAGYEILEKVDGFGTTSEMFEANYWRAKEGELARTILAAPGMRSARVHIANPVGKPFQRGATPTASVTLTTNYGPLDPQIAEAIRYMVSSAVAGLAPTSVSVIDAAHGVVLRMGEAAGDPRNGRLPGGAREAQLRAEVERLLAARVGEGKAIVTVAVDAEMQSEIVTERLVDPQSRVAISTDTRDVSENATGGVGGAATVASNLPQAGGGGQESTRARTEAEERVNYEVSQTTRERIKPAGAVKRLTVAVLVDGVASFAADGTRTWAPRPQAELDQLRQLVQSAVGFNGERGDVVTVEMLEFAERPGVGVTATSGVGAFFERNAMNLIQMGVLAMVALGLMLFVLRPLMRAAELQTIPGDPDTPMLEWPEGARRGVDDEDAPLDRLSLLKQTFEERRDDSATVLRSWLERDVNETADKESDAA